eukprot:jgi/Ulvmu1/3016/UM015_0056.1
MSMASGASDKAPLDATTCSGIASCTGFKGARGTSTAGRSVMDGSWAPSRCRATGPSNNIPHLHTCCSAGTMPWDQSTHNKLCWSRNTWLHTHMQQCGQVPPCPCSREPACLDNRSIKHTQTWGSVRRTNTSSMPSLAWSGLLTSCLPRAVIPKEKRQPKTGSLRKREMEETRQHKAQARREKEEAARQKKQQKEEEKACKAQKQADDKRKRDEEKERKRLERERIRAETQGKGRKRPAASKPAGAGGSMVPSPAGEGPGTAVGGAAGKKPPPARKVQIGRRHAQKINQ